MQHPGSIFHHDRLPNSLGPLSRYSSHMIKKTSKQEKVPDLYQQNRRSAKVEVQQVCQGIEATKKPSLLSFFFVLVLLTRLRWRSQTLLSHGTNYDALVSAPPDRD